MSWVTVIWSMVVSACLTLAVINLLVWSRDRRSWAHLCFSFMVVGVIGLAIAEMGTMKASSPEEFGRVIRWAHLVHAFGIVGSLGFVHFYFGTGRRWLLAMAVGLRLLAVVVNFTAGLNLHISSIHSLRTMTLFGEQVTVLGEWVPSPWASLGLFASLIWLIYVVDASVRLWRKGSHDSRRRAVIVGGSLVFFCVLSVGQAVLIAEGALGMPFMVSFPFLAVVLAMAYELSRDMIRAAQLARELQLSEAELRLSQRRMELAASQRLQSENARKNLAAIVESSDDAILSKTLEGIVTTWNAGAEKIYGYSANEMVGQHVLTLAPVELKQEVPEILERLRRGESVDHLETVRVTKDGRRIDVSLTISPIKDEHGITIGASTIARDITERKQAEQQALQQRNELAHLSRVTMLGELATSLAHELNQPLGAILRNTEAAELFLQDPSPDMDELRAILADIRRDDHRAGGVIDRMRSMLKPRAIESSLLDLNVLASEVLSIVRPDADLRKVQFAIEAAPSIPLVRGDRVQVQQVLLNLMLNAMDAMNGSAPDRCLVTVCVKPLGTQVQVAVSDSGLGIPDDKLARLFEPFFTTKANGMGMGLSISRTIIESHGGNVGAENNPNGGATFYFMLPVAEEGENTL